jgi:hypothetical protein
LWRGELFTARANRALVPYAPRRDVYESVREVLGWASKILSHRQPSDRDRLAWIYHAHRRTALFVADEIAKRYFTDRVSLGNVSRLEAALPKLRERIKAAYPHRVWSSRVTPRRLALALVDHVFEPLFPRPLLEPGRRVGLTDGRLWNEVFPPEYRKRMKALLPAESVHQLLSWPRRELDEHPSGKWFLSWWAILLNVLGPYYPGYWTNTERSPASTDTRSIKLLSHPGVEEWAAEVWDALHR